MGAAAVRGGAVGLATDPLRDPFGRRIHLFATGSMAFGPKPCNHCGNDTGFEMGVSPLPPGDLSGPLTCHNCGKVPTVSGAEGAAARRMRAED